MNSRTILKISLFFGAALSYLSLLLNIAAQADTVVFRPSPAGMFAGLTFVGATFFWIIYLTAYVVMALLNRSKKHR